VKLLLGAIEDLSKTLLDRSKQIAESTGLSAVQADDLDKIEQYLANYQLYKKSKSEWVWQIKNDQLIVQPVFGREFIRDLVWKRAEHYIVSSATILNPLEYAEMTGLLDFLTEDEICYLTVPSTFPVENRPIIDATVGPLSAQYLSSNMPKAVKAVEAILEKEPGNVAIHCHSYLHQRNLVESISEKLKPRLIVHTSRDREERLKEWMESRGQVFVSVAFGEGQDWKYEICEAQILLKVPFPDLGDKRIARRLEMGHRNWYQNQALLEVIQAYGRAIRAEDDKARFYIVDGSFARLAHDCWEVIPDWFKEALPPSFLNSS
jgi:Rad3-related DNA helicase